MARYMVLLEIETDELTVHEMRKKEAWAFLHGPNPVADEVAKVVQVLVAKAKATGK